MVSTPVYGKYKKCWVLPQEKFQLMDFLRVLWGLPEISAQFSKGFNNRLKNFAQLERG